MGPDFAGTGAGLASFFFEAASSKLENNDMPPPKLPMYIESDVDSCHWLIIFKECEDKNVPSLVNAVAEQVQQVPAKLLTAIPPFFIIQIRPEALVNTNSHITLAQSLTSSVKLDCIVKVLSHSKQSVVLTEHGCIEVIYDEHTAKAIASAFFEKMNPNANQ